MVIRDLDLIGIAVPPSEAHAELIVDPNAMLTFTVAAQRPQFVTGRNSQILQSSGRVKHGQLLLRDISQIRRRHSSALARVPKFLRVFVREGFDHSASLTGIVNNGKH